MNSTLATKTLKPQRDSRDLNAPLTRHAAPRLSAQAYVNSYATQATDYLNEHPNTEASDGEYIWETRLECTAEHPRLAKIGWMLGWVRWFNE